MADLEHVIVSGQSLSVGWNGTPLLSTTTEDPDALRIHPATGAVTALEGSHPLYPDWQLPEFTLGYRVAATLPAGDTVGVASHGYGGASIAELSKGGSTGRFAQSVNTAGTVAAAQAAAGQTYRVRALHWMQGEADQNNLMTAADYQTAFTALVNDYRTDLPVATGQAEDFPVILSQIAMTYGDPATVAIGQLEASRTLPDVHLAGPQYQLPHGPDNIHLTNVGYYRLGEYHARAHNALATVGDWRPLTPVSIAAAGQQVTVTFDVPTPPLVFDTSTVPAQPNMGFTLGGTSAQITDVSITSPTTVTLTTDRALSGTVTVGYASDLLAYRAAGNLRDSDTATSGYDGAPLANWGVIFRETVATTREPVGLRFASAAYVQAGGALYRLRPEPPNTTQPTM